MSLQALILVLLAALVHASWNIVAKKAGGDVRFVFFSTFFLILVWAPVGMVLGWRQIPHWQAAEWQLILASGVLHMIYFITLLRGYRAADLTVVYPLARGTGPLLTAWFAVSFLGESLNWLGVSGIAGVVLGVLLIAGWPALLRSGRCGRQEKRLRHGLAYGLLTGCWIASYTLVDGYGVKWMLMSPILIDYLGAGVRLILLLPVMAGMRGHVLQHWRQQWRSALMVGIFSPVAYVLVLYAMQTAPLSLVAPARELSMLFAALLGGRLLGEGERSVRILGALLIIVGVSFLALA